MATEAPARCTVLVMLDARDAEDLGIRARPAAIPGIIAKPMATPRSDMAITM